MAFSLFFSPFFSRKAKNATKIIAITVSVAAIKIAFPGFEMFRDCRKSSTSSVLRFGGPKRRIIRKLKKQNRNTIIAEEHIDGMS